uniref:Mediator of RNA polymerase II transcription subunit 6 n=1 Tax=Myxobolus squamalis TaxID=59785 RepID=A0A6B2G6T1_MYXSQ
MDDPASSYSLSWRDEACLPNLNGNTVLNYFCQTSNPFYDRTCNNEIIKMQRLNISALVNMCGIEYELITNQEPALYVICKQKRVNVNSAVPIAYYYILNGTVYQCPDALCFVRNKLVRLIHIQIRHHPFFF